MKNLWGLWLDPNLIYIKIFLFSSDFIFERLVLFNNIKLYFYA